MATAATRVEDLTRIDHDEVFGLVSTENQRVLDLLRSLEPEEWTRRTDCTAWDVRALAAHVLGSMEGATSFGAVVRQMVRAQRAKGDGPLVDGMTRSQVEDRAGLTVEQLLDRMAEAGPRNARWRGGNSRFLRTKLKMTEEVGGRKERWTFGYLNDVILLRDTWMHRVDLARATGRELVLTADHDGRIVADVVAEWAGRHGRPFTLHLEGPAGGSFAAGGGGEELTLDAVELCRALSGRGPAEGLLATEVPF